MKSGKRPQLGRGLQYAANYSTLRWRCLLPDPMSLEGCEMNPLVSWFSSVMTGWFASELAKATGCEKTWRTVHSSQFMMKHFVSQHLTATREVVDKNFDYSLKAYVTKWLSDFSAKEAQLLKNLFKFSWKLYYKKQGWANSIKNVFHKRDRFLNKTNFLSSCY